jgi:hypothetical protein
MPLRLLDGKSPAFRARTSFGIEASWKIETHEHAGDFKEW